MMFSKITNYFTQSFQELKRVNWPKRNEVIKLSLIVIIATVIATLIVAGIDWLLSQLLNYFVMK
ncbi:MAG TPA: preprotein translocase subunit SecE [Patescibacteria group bacterium]|nr:preprotein translocase subunit SecE [Patescibacteria group bacterium]